MTLRLQRVRRRRPLSCVVVGDAAITIRCAEILRERGERLLGVITGEDRVAAWCAERRVRCRFEPPETPLTAAALAALIGDVPLDLLFSIHSVRVLGAEVLALPRRMAVNYHDALLPRYAGLHATSWAILQGETCHGITWHRMSERIDAGNILLQREVPIEPGDSAWALGLRCAQAGSETFPELLNGLASGRLALRPQQLGDRTRFPGWQRPAAGCVVPLDATAAQISAFVRALDFGAADNPLGMAKLLAPGGALLVQEIEVLDRRHDLPPGTVVAILGDTLEIATATDDVRLSVQAEGLASRAVAVGVVLPAKAPDAAELESKERSLYPHEGFWTSLLAEAAPLMPPGFMVDFATAATGEQRLDLELDGGLLSALAAEGDPQDVLLAAALAWLALEVGQPFDVGLGEADLRRELATHGWLSLFALRRPMRIELAAGATLSSFVAATVRQRKSLRDHGTYPLDLTHRVRRLRALRRLEPAVVIDLLAADEAQPGPALGPSAALGLTLDRAGRQIVWRWRGAAVASIDDQVRRFSGWLAAAAASAAATADCPLRPRQGGASLRDLFQAQVAATPHAVALESGGVRWSYAALAERAGRLAAALRRRGVRAERLVALRLERLSDLVTGLLAVLEAGGAFLVLDPLEPAYRRAQILAETRPFLVLGDGGLKRPAPELFVHPITLADAPESSAPVAARATMPEDLAYVATTSGSMGAPKGVAIEQRSIAHYVAVAGGKFGLSAGDRLLYYGSPAFDLAYEAIFAALCHGATLVGIPAGSLAEPREILGQCARLRITVLDLPTAIWHQVARELERPATPFPTRLRLVIIGGEQASTRAARAWARHGSRRVRLLNSYGPTEATIVSTWWEAPLAADALPAGDVIPIGRPIAGAETYILDGQVQRVLTGEAGELWLGGVGLARGYHRRPDLTAERFVRIAAVGGKRLYRTGDLVREGVDGELEFLGRIDRQIKIAGRRIEPAEVETVLQAIPGVMAAAVAPLGSATAASDENRTKLVAWVVLAAGVAVAAIKAEAAKRLPSAMRPVRMIQVAALPRLPAGKVDLRALAAAAGGEDPQPATAPAAPPRGVVESVLAGIWERHLGSGEVARDEDFFVLGGDSLATVSLLAAIEETFGRRVPIAQLLRAPTIAALASYLEEQGAAPRQSSCLVELQGAGNGRPLVCVHGLGGHLLRLMHLARALAPDQRLLGLQCPGLDDDQPVPTSVEELARSFLGQLRDAAGAGPLHLGGMSFGGIVAFEMARQAVAVGGEVGLLAMFDTDLAEVTPGWRTPPPTWRARLRGQLRRAVGDQLGRRRRLARRLIHGQDAIRKANEYRNFTRVMRFNEAALARYELGPYEGRITYFSATARDPRLFAEFMGRTGCTLDVVPVGGDHLSMLEPPHVEALATELRRRIAAPAEQAGS